MKEYYRDESVTLFHGDMREALPGLAGDVVLTDPPYNAGKKYGLHDDGMSAEAYQVWIRGALEACAVAAPELVYFPGVRNLLDVKTALPFPLVPVRVLAWHKREFAGDKWCGGPAMCWEPVVWASRSEKPRFNKVFGELGRDFLIVPSTHGDPFAKLHPCPKPPKVMRWLVGLFCPPGGLIIDPFAGTGTTLRAAKDLGRRAIGIEIEERYCEVAARRLEQGILSFPE